MCQPIRPPIGERMVYASKRSWGLDAPRAFPHVCTAAKHGQKTMSPIPSIMGIVSSENSVEEDTNPAPKR